MNSALYQTHPRVVSLEGMTELVRGNDAQLVAMLAPVVRTESVALDLNHVNRIDAAGIAALISLYGCAHDAGHAFHICNVSARVEEILSLVGLDHILVSDSNALVSEPCPAVPAPGCEQRPAA